MLLPGLAVVILLLLSKRKRRETSPKHKEEMPGEHAVEELPGWVTFLTGLVCLALSSWGIWLGVMGIAGQFFGVYCNRNFYGLFEISGILAIPMGLLFLIISVACFFAAFVLFREVFLGDKGMMEKHEPVGVAEKSVPNLSQE